MQKNGSKKKRRMKGAFRRAIGAVFMASAILIAAIPVDNLGAVGTRAPKITVNTSDSGIPIVASNETVFSTGDGVLQFACTNVSGQSSKVAVILGYEGGYLHSDTLTIPDNVDAYTMYSDPQGGSGFCLSARNGAKLFYQKSEPVVDASGNPVYENTTEQKRDGNGNPVYDENGNPVYVQQQKVNYSYKPCYYADSSNWKDITADKLYYLKNDGTYALTTSTDYQPLRGVPVRYIGNQYLNAGTGSDSGTWSVAGTIEDASKGIFRGEKAGNVVTLNVGKELEGVGNYAFYGCNNLKSITLGNALSTIGNYAFANCINMEHVNLDRNAIITKIGDHAFYNCDALTQFQMPISVVQIGDSAFEDCYQLKQVDLCGNGSNVALEKLGYDVFRNCPSLEGIEFPKNYAESDLEIGMWEGCTSLKYIKVGNNAVDFKQDSSGEFTFDDFKATVPSEFYFEGGRGTKLQETATSHDIAYKYLDQDVYEIYVDDGTGRKALYQVNSQNQLVKCEIPEGMERVVMPETVGPYKIDQIWGNSFRNNCYLKEIVIPSSVKEIAEGAFRGCHNLETVYFTEPVNLTVIGKDAFKTQDIATSDHKPNCTQKTLKSKPQLYFVGPVSEDCEAFRYSMNADNYINVPGQERSYITYCSGWPTNLLVQYDPATDKNTLIDYPTFYDISNYATSDYPYLTNENKSAAATAVNKYIKNQALTDAENMIINAALNLYLPPAIEAVQKDLFVQKEAKDQYNVQKTLTAGGLHKIDDGAFKNCRNFKAIHLTDKTQKIGGKAFENCTALVDVTIPPTVTEMGNTPFIGCTSLSYVNFMNSKYFSCPSSESAMIYKLDANGKPYRIEELLQGRVNRRIAADEFAGISELAPEAFRGTKAGIVDMRESAITIIPQEAFADTHNLDTVYFPRQWSRVEQDAFKDSSVEYLEIYGEYGNIDNSAFSGSTNSTGTMTFYCEKDGSADHFAKVNNIRTVYIAAERYYKVTFYDYDLTVLSTQQVQAGDDAEPPKVPDRPGYIFKGWSYDYHNITRDMDIKAEYEVDSNYNTVLVTFYDYDGTVLDKQRIPVGGNVLNPPVPSRAGYRFLGWSVGIANVQEDINPHAIYEYDDGTYTVRFFDEDESTLLYSIPVKPNEDCILPQNPVKNGKTFVKWLPSPVKVTSDMDVFAVYQDANGNTNQPSGTANNVSAKLYTLTVKNGLGTGSFVAGANVVIRAQEAGTNQEFVNWTVDPSDVEITDKNITAAILTMPAKDVTVTANFKAKGSSSSSTTVDQDGGGVAATTTKKTGNTVIIDKSGLSNTNIVSVSVTGSTDNFTVKVREDANASEMALRALKAEFDDDLTDIKYFPMDISLYDETGQKQITDVTGLSVNITLPIPDSLVEYAGNNRIASVSGGKLENLKARFTTIAGVPCISFKAEHFSPYVIYVNTNKLTAATVYDKTPKTGDRIHPKWFLSIGLFSVAIFLFLKKDRKVKRKAVATAVLFLACMSLVMIMKIPVYASSADCLIEGRKLTGYSGSEKVVSIPDGVEIIGKSAFENHSEIQKVVFPNTLNRIKPYAFWGCDSLQEIVFGRKFCDIGDYAFANCKGLTSLYLPATVRTIGIRAFADCSNLTKIYIPASVSYIHESAFDGCTKLVIEYEEGTYAEKYASEFYKKQATMIASRIKAGNTAINAASSSKKTESDTKTDSNRKTDSDTNSDSNIKTDSDLSTIRDNTPEKNSGNAQEAEGKLLGSTKVVSGSAVILMDNRKPTVIQGTLTPAREPGMLTNGPVKYRIVDDKILADQAYYKDRALREAVLPDGIEEIGEFAFARSLIEKAEIPEGVKVISYGAFYHCDHLESVSIPETVIRVEPESFSHTAWVDDFLAGENSSIGDYLISGGVLIAYRGEDEKPLIPDSVRVIASGCFSGHREIKEIVLPDALNVIGEGAFGGCSALRRIQWNEKQLTISDRAFAGCGLEEIMIPANVVRIGIGAFDQDVEIKYEGAAAQTGYEASAQRLSNIAYRFPGNKESTSGNRSYNRIAVAGPDGTRADLTGASGVYTLKLSENGDLEKAQRAYQRNLGYSLPDHAVCYSMQLHDASVVPITRLGQDLLRVTMPLPKRFENGNVRIFEYDRNGQLE